MLVEETLKIAGSEILLRTSKGAGPPLLFIPGGVVDHIDLTWKPVVHGLARTHAVLAPDLPGFGRSRGLPARAYDAAFVADFASELIHRKGVHRPVLLANSLSGGAAIRLALDHPDAFRGLVLSGAYGWQPRVPFHAAVYPIVRLQRAEALIGGFMRFPGVVRTALRTLVLSQDCVDAELIRDAQAGVEAPDAPRAFVSWLRNEMRPASLCNDFRSRLNALRLPTLVLQGSHDWLAPAQHARAAAAAIPGAEYHELRARHLLPRELPAEVEMIIRTFLDRLSPW